MEFQNQMNFYEKDLRIMIKSGEELLKICIKNYIKNYQMREKENGYKTYNTRKQNMFFWVL